MKQNITEKLFANISSETFDFLRNVSEMFLVLYLLTELSRYYNHLCEENFLQVQVLSQKKWVSVLGTAALNMLIIFLW